MTSRRWNSRAKCWLKAWEQSLKNTCVHREVHSSLQKWSWVLVHFLGGGLAPGRKVMWGEGASKVCGRAGSVSHPWESHPGTLSLSHPMGTSPFVFWCGSRAHFRGESPDHPPLTMFWFTLQWCVHKEDAVQMRLNKKTGFGRASNESWVLEWIRRHMNIHQVFEHQPVCCTDWVRLIHNSC